MNIAQITDNLEKLVESFNKVSFIFTLLLAYGTPKSTLYIIEQAVQLIISGEIVNYQYAGEYHRRDFN